MAQFERLKNDKKELLRLLREQPLIVDAMAEFVSEQAELLEFEPDDYLIEQDSSSQDVFFILAGAVRIIINGREKRNREAPAVVGELAAMDASQNRAASVQALAQTLAAKLTYEQFEELLSQNDGWRMLAVETAKRLREWTSGVRQRNDIPRIFLGSTSERLRDLHILEKDLRSPKVDVGLWSKGIFEPSGYPLPSLLNEAERADFAVLLLTPDDVVQSRDNDAELAPRDNVLFEIGLFTGAFGDKRRVFIACEDPGGIKIPSDLKSLTLLVFDPNGVDPFAEISATILDRVEELGPR